MMPTKTEQVLTRLRLCALEISGINHAVENPTAGSIEPGALPVIIHYLGADSSIHTSEEVSEITLEVIGRVYAAQTATDDNSTAGAYAFVLTNPIKARVREYFRDHAYLKTASLDSLNFLLAPVRYTSTQIGVLQGTDYVGFEYTLSLQWREFTGES